MKRAVLEIAIHSLRTKRKNRVSAVRLNGTSDIVWERRKFVLFPEVKAWLTRKFPIAEMEQNTINRLFPTLQFYDYTAIRCRDSLENYHLTFSIKEDNRSDEHTSELQSLIRNSYAVFCLKQKKNN